MMMQQRELILSGGSGVKRLKLLPKSMEGSNHQNDDTQRGKRKSVSVLNAKCRLYIHTYIHTDRQT